MIDLCLKFDDAKQAEAVLFTDGQPRFDASIDVIGTIYKPTGKMLKTADGLMPEMSAVPGWHVNYRGAEAEDLQAYCVYPQTPVRGWA